MVINHYWGSQTITDTTSYIISWLCSICGYMVTAPHEHCPHCGRIITKCPNCEQESYYPQLISVGG